ncbi:MAG: bifunctional diguanylate cyclase/phosphodiesterase [Betaproteobacteria bacterium]|nr:bifunctional diguanylate cyclase/phosphodiesterase [Betaproteobacteria bacterium]
MNFLGVCELDVSASGMIDDAGAGAEASVGDAPLPESFHDALTGLPNRRGARELIEASLHMGAQAGESVSVVCIDLDNFRSINEGYGHDVAEAVLQNVGARLRRCASGSGRVCRSGGDEFLVIRRGAASEEEVRSLVPRLMACIQQPLEAAGETLIVTASIGVATHECAGGSFDALMQRAGHAMSRAKRLGRNTWYFAAREPIPCLQHQALKTRLYRALEQDRLALHYQPIVDLRSGQVRSFEALMRWTDEELGEVSPARFIPVAEESGLMGDLGAWAIEQACRQSAAWREAFGSSKPIAVNVSAVQLQRGEFEHDLRRILQACSVQPGMLELEVTESALIHDAAHLAGMSQRLRDLGVGVAIDDFGTGYSNLLYLKHFHPAKIKIDRSFVQTILSTEEDRAIVRAVIDMAHAIGARVVAEGVELGAVAQMLRALGCDEAQGYHFARPCPAGLLGAWLQPDRADPDLVA